MFIHMIYNLISALDYSAMAEVLGAAATSEEGTGGDHEATSDEDLHEESFVYKAKPTKIKVDSRLLSGFCLEAAVPLEEGLNLETMGIIVGKRIGRNILMTNIVIPNQDMVCHDVATWVME